MIDILEAVNDFILAYAQGQDLPTLTQKQIIRSWQNLDNILSQTQEAVVLTLQSVRRHGTNVHTRRNADAETGIIETVSCLNKYEVQIDFCALCPQIPEYVPRVRAENIEILAQDGIGVTFFLHYGLSSCYADTVQAVPFTKESDQYISRYSITLHISGWKHIETNLDSFTDVKVHFENVDEHHPIGTQGD